MRDSFVWLNLSVNVIRVSLLFEKDLLCDVHWNNTSYLLSTDDSAPTISVTPSPRMPGEGSVEVRMYKEAEEQRNRREQQQRERMLEIQHQMEQRILNERSEEMARTRQERLLRNVFEEVAQKQRDHINFIELGDAMKRLGLFKSNASQHVRKNEEEVKIHEALWEVMDSEESGWVDMEAFMWIMLPILTSTDDVEDDEVGFILGCVCPIHGMHKRTWYS